MRGVEEVGTAGKARGRVTMAAQLLQRGRGAGARQLSKAAYDGGAADIEC